MIVGAVAKLGFIADLISKPTMIGYMNGLALTILVGQLPKLFGFKVEAEDLVGGIAGFARGLARGEAVPAGRRGRYRRDSAGPGTTALAAQGPRRARHGRARDRLDGALRPGRARRQPYRSASQGIPAIHYSGRARGRPRAPIRRSPGIALVSLADTISTASAFAARTGQEVHGNHEMAGIGVANLAAGLFQGFPVSTSASRTAVAERADAKTELTGVTGAGVITLMIVLLPGLFRNLPQPALAAVVVTASLSLAGIPGGGPAVAAAQIRVRPVGRGPPRRGPVRACCSGSPSRSARRFSASSGGRARSRARP